MPTQLSVHILKTQETWPKTTMRIIFCCIAKVHSPETAKQNTGKDL